MGVCFKTFLPFQGQLIIHGACLEAYCCIKALLALGIDTHRIIVVTSPGDEMSWEKLHGYRDTAKVDFHRYSYVKIKFQL